LILANGFQEFIPLGNSFITNRRTLNTVEILTERVKDLEELEDKDLKTLGEKGKEKKEEANEGEVKQLHMKHNVKK
jgi:hypothetical protein